MPTKQLEILVKARDEASGVIRGVGDAAEETGEKFGGLNSLVEAGHGLHKTVRAAKNIIVAFEVLPVAFNSVKALYATLSGTAEDAATSQRKLYEAIKEFPVIGKPVAEAVEWIGAAIAHALGAESTADIEAEMAEKKRIMEEFADDAKKLAADLAKTSDEAALVGLLPGEAAIEKAKQEYKKKIDALQKVKADSIKDAGAAGENFETGESKVKRVFEAVISFGGSEVGRAAGGDDPEVAARRLAFARQRNAALDQVNKELVEKQADLAKLEAAAIAKAHAQEEEEQRAFDQRSEDMARLRNSALADIVAEGYIKQLQADDQGEKARFVQLQRGLEKELEAITANRQKQLAALDKEAAGLQPAAAAGNQTAKDRLEEIGIDRERANADFDKQSKAAQAGEASQERAERDKALQQSKVAILREQAAAGDKLAKGELQQIEFTEQQKNLENTLLQILHDQHSTQQQQIDAQQQLDAMKDAAAKNLQAHHDDVDRDLMQSKIDQLRKEGELGDRAAAKEAEKLEIQQRYNDEKKKLNEILSDQQATDAEKQEARDQLGHLDKDESKELAQAGKDKLGAPQLANLDVSQFLTGVAAKAEQQKSDPVLDEAKTQTGIMSSIATTLSAWLAGKNEIPTPIRLT